MDLNPLIKTYIGSLLSALSIDFQIKKIRRRDTIFLFVFTLTFDFLRLIFVVSSFFFFFLLLNVCAPKTNEDGEASVQRNALTGLDPVELRRWKQPRVTPDAPPLPAGLETYC